MLHFDAVVPYAGQFLQGMIVTLVLSALVVAVSFALGVPFALARIGRSRLLRGLVFAYVHLLRNTPLLVILYVIFFGLGASGIVVPSFAAGVVALSLNGTAYTTEIYRGGLAGVSAHQVEAANALGFTSLPTWRYIILPQAIRFVFYPLGNQIVATILGSSLVMIIATQDLTFAAFDVGARTFRYFESFIAVAAMYFLLVQLFNRCWKALGRHFLAGGDVPL